MIDDKLKREIILWAFVGLIIVGVFLAIAPWYNVYSQTQAGKAKLAEAEYSRQITVAEARAKEEAAKALAQAEVIRAEGTAAAIEKVGKSLQQNPGYTNFLYIQSLADTNDRSGEKTVIYVPTQNGVPIRLPESESTRLQQ